MKLIENALSKNCNKIRCTVVSHQLNETTEFFVFKTKTLIFSILTKVNDANVNWSVSRQEQDFYTLRSLLVLSFGQCFIPPLLPSNKESNFDSKSIKNRQKSFTRFLRSILKSPFLSALPLVLEFLKIDHHKIDSKFGMKDFTKRLMYEETELNKKASFFNKEVSKNGLYRITAPTDTIDLTQDFSENLLDKKLGKSLMSHVLDEQKYV